MNNLAKVGPCGTSCSECLAANDDPKVIDMLVEKGLPREVLPCLGCRSRDGHCPSPSLGGKQCEIYLCAEKQNLDFCFQCDDAPCDRLMPCQKTGHYVYHNMKCFNLMFIEKHGVDAFVENAGRIQSMFFNNELKKVGESPE